MTMLSKPQLDLLIAADVAGGSVAIPARLSVGSGGGTFASLVRLRLACVRTLADGSRQLTITEAGRKRVRFGARLRTPARVEEALAKVASGRVGRKGRVPGYMRTGSGSGTPRGKLGLVQQLLERSEGATLQEIAEATGWKEASIRSTLSTQFRRRFRAALRKEVAERGVVYRLAKDQTDLADQREG